MRIRYTPASLDDLKNIKGYIAEILYNQIASQNVINRIIKTINLLKNSPTLGRKLEEKTSIETDLRYILSNKYIIIYRIENDCISIIRIIDTRTNYLSIIEWGEM